MRPGVPPLSLPHPEGCPSELRLDRYFHQELAEQDGAAVKAHLDGCAYCKERITLRQGGFASLPAIDPAASLAAIERSLGAPPPPAPWLERVRALLRPRVVLPGLVAAAAAAIAVIAVAPRPPEDEVRAKGTLELAVHRERDGKVERLAPGARARAGDRLRFSARVPAEPGGEIMILSLEAEGRITVLYPEIGADRSRPWAPDAEGVLPGAVVLDDYAQQEWLVLVYCPRPFQRAELAARASRIAAPEGCATEQLLLRGSP
jgi:hypothetical protein